MDSRAWSATLHEVAKNWMRLKQLSTLRQKNKRKINKWNCIKLKKKKKNKTKKKPLHSKGNYQRNKRLPADYHISDRD